MKNNINKAVFKIPVLIPDCLDNMDDDGIDYEPINFKVKHKFKLDLTKELVDSHSNLTDETSQSYLYFDNVANIRDISYKIGRIIDTAREHFNVGIVDYEDETKEYTPLTEKGIRSLEWEVNYTILLDFCKQTVDENDYSYKYLTDPDDPQKFESNFRFTTDMGFTNYLFQCQLVAQFFYHHFMNYVKKYITLSPESVNKFDIGFELSPLFPLDHVLDKETFDLSQLWDYAEQIYDSFNIKDKVTLVNFNAATLVSFVK